MKRNDLDKLNREIRRQQKKAKIANKRDESAGDVKTYAQNLFNLLQYDENCIFNTREDEDLLELFLGFKDEIPEDKWEQVLRKAIRMTKVADKDSAYTELRAALDE